IGLPIDRESVRRLCLLEVFLSGNGLIVTPVVLLVTDNATNPILNPTEVTQLFSMPLPSFLYDRPSLIPGWHFGLSGRVSLDPAQQLPPPEIDYADGQGRVGGKEGRYYQYRDVSWGSGVVRMHRFLTGREGGGIKPVYGLTAAILIRAAIVGFARVPTFEVVAPGQKNMEERMVWDVRNGAGPLRRAIEAEGLWEEWKPDTAKL
ncbi:MAG: hypothetical protein TREMPRED_005957, partial [Tremellales sp. Tagirdzhanova-0007]